MRLTTFAATLLGAVLASGCTVTVTDGVREPTNLGTLKSELTRYHDDGAYERDIATITARAQAYIDRRAPQVERPAIVLDIDETSLSNWAPTVANDYGYIPEGPCDRLPRGPCGYHAWENSGQATVIAPTLALYNAARARGVSVFFITGRREAQRQGTEGNLRSAGYTEWAGVSMRPQDSHAAAAAYKSAERARIEAQGYTIIANIGDQQSDLDGGHSERTFKLPNPFYFIP